VVAALVATSGLRLGLGAAGIVAVVLVAVLVIAVLVVAACGMTAALIVMVHVG